MHLVAQTLEEILQENNACSFQISRGSKSLLISIMLAKILQLHQCDEFLSSQERCFLLPHFIHVQFTCQVFYCFFPYFPHWMLSHFPFLFTNMLYLGVKQFTTFVLFCVVRPRCNWGVGGEFFWIAIIMGAIEWQIICSGTL